MIRVISGESSHQPIITITTILPITATSLQTIIQEPIALQQTVARDLHQTVVPAHQYQGRIVVDKPAIHKSLNSIPVDKKIVLHEKKYTVGSYAYQSWFLCPGT